MGYTENKVLAVRLKDSSIQIHFFLKALENAYKEGKQWNQLTQMKGSKIRPEFLKAFFPSKITLEMFS